MIGGNLKAQKPWITKTNLQWNHVDRGCQLWQETCNSGISKSTETYNNTSYPNLIGAALSFQYGLSN
jgi:hypothetical protein